MIEYEAGAIPSNPLTIIVKDELDNAVNVVGYDSWELQMKDTDDNEVDLSGVSIIEIPQVIGAFSVAWPKNRSLFEKRGSYILRFVLSKQDGSKDITRTAEINVRDFGRIK